MVRIRFVTALFAAAVLASGCGLFSNAETTPDDSKASLTVVNRSTLAVCEVFLSPRAADTWGENRLREDEHIGPEQAYVFYLPAGRWNVRLDDCAGRPVFGRRNLLVKGSKRIDFRVVEVQRKPWIGARRFAESRRGETASF